MKKCTLCVDRIYNENIAEDERVPACVRACPTGARHFGDIGDPKSEVSALIAERGGFDLLPEFGVKPVNKYLPPRAENEARTDNNQQTGSLPKIELEEKIVLDGHAFSDRLFAWTDRILSR